MSHRVFVVGLASGLTPEADDPPIRWKDTTKYDDAYLAGVNHGAKIQVKPDYVDGEMLDEQNLSPRCRNRKLFGKIADPTALKISVRLRSASVYNCSPLQAAGCRLPNANATCHVTDAINLENCY